MFLLLFVFLIRSFLILFAIRCSPEKRLRLKIDTCLKSDESLGLILFHVKCIEEQLFVYKEKDNDVFCQ